MKSTKRKIKPAAVFGVGFILYFLWVLIAIPLSTQQPHWAKRLLQQGEPAEFHERRSYFSNLSEIGVESDCLYLLYGDFGVLELYTLDGSYRRSYAVYTPANGQAHLHRSEEGLILEGKDRTLYLFRDGAFVRKLLDSDETRSSFLDEAAERLDEAGNRYQRASFGMRVVRERPDGGKDLILRRPFYLIFAQQTPRLLLAALLFLPLFIVFVQKSNQRKAEQEADKVSWRKELEFSNWRHHPD